MKYQQKPALVVKWLPKPQLSEEIQGEIRRIMKNHSGCDDFLIDVARIMRDENNKVSFDDLPPSKFKQHLEDTLKHLNKAAKELEQIGDGEQETLRQNYCVVTQEFKDSDLFDPINQFIKAINDTLEDIAPNKTKPVQTDKYLCIKQLKSAYEKHFKRKASPEKGALFWQIAKELLYKDNPARLLKAAFDFNSDSEPES